MACTFHQCHRKKTPYRLVTISVIPEDCNYIVHSLSKYQNHELHESNVLLCILTIPIMKGRE